jgi:hypothetical protein
MHDVTCPHCLASLTIPAAAEGAIRCPECGQAFEQGEPPSVDALAHRDAAASRGRGPHIDYEIASLTGDVAETDLFRSPLHSLSPSTVDTEPPPAPPAPRTGGGRLWTYVGAAAGLAAVLVLAFGANRAVSQGTNAAPATVRPQANIAAAPLAPAPLETPTAAPVPHANTPTPQNAAPERGLTAASPSVPQSVHRAAAGSAPVHVKETAAVAAPQAPPAPETTAAAEEQPADGPAFDHAAATNTIADAARQTKDCFDPSVGPGTTGVAITFNPAGRVSRVVLEGAPVFNGTPVAACIIAHMRRITVPPFTGEKTTLHTKVTVE